VSIYSNKKVIKPPFLRGVGGILVGFWGKGEGEKGKKKPLTLPL
jgi:hypothetical protein